MGETWTVHQSHYEDAFGPMEILDENGEALAEVFGTPEQADQMAAAPQLAEALRAVEWIDDDDGDGVLYQACPCCHERRMPEDTRHSEHGFGCQVAAALALIEVR